MVEIPASPTRRTRWKNAAWMTLAILIGTWMGYGKYYSAREKRRQAEYLRKWSAALPFASSASEAEFKGDWADAERHWSAAIAAHPEDPDMWFRRGRCRVLMRHDREAVEDFTRARDLTGQPLVVIPHRARALARLGDWEAAEKDAEELVAANEQDASALGVKGMILVGRQRYDEAVPRLLEALATLPEDPDFLLALMRAHSATGYNEGVREAAGKLFRACLLDPVLNDEVIGALVEAGGRDVGLRPDFLRSSPGWEGRALWWLARLAWMEGATETARSRYREAVDRYARGSAERVEVEWEQARFESGAPAPATWKKAEEE